MKIQKEHISTLKTYLSNEGAILSEKPNGQSMYSFSNGLIVNIYETTGSINIQGQCSNPEFKKVINTFIDVIKVA